MSYLKFDKALLTNAEKSLKKEILRTNRAGSYNSTTIIDCNTRKYHGQLVVSCEDLSDTNCVLLSSFDETVVQHGAEFNLGIHQYEGNFLSPNGHKYIREFDCDIIPRTTYRVGGVILSKERLLVSSEDRLLIKYTLIDAHSPTLLRFKPFLAFRSVDTLTRENPDANTNYNETSQGISMCLYDGYPDLFMQFSKKNSYHHFPNWYRNLEYYKERERGYDSVEDLLVPGYFELPIKKGESVYFSAGLSSVAPRSLKALWERELKARTHRVDLFSSLVNSAQQLYFRQKGEEKLYLVAGYPWFKVRARDEFVSLFACTWLIGDQPSFYRMMDTAMAEIAAFMRGESNGLVLKGLGEPDVLLWFVRAVQQYAEKTSLQEAGDRYSDIILNIIQYIRSNSHPNLSLHSTGLVFVEGTEKVATWMNAEFLGRPITPRTGYVVEINALWYNALKFAASLQEACGDSSGASLLNYRAETTGSSFVQTFWNGTYLFDYVDGVSANQELRPNMILAVGLPFSPLDKSQKKSILDIATRELLTPKGLRSLSPKSGFYSPIYVGGQLERDRNYHNGPVWSWTFGAYATTYLQIYKRRGASFIERIVSALEAEMSELCVGTISELFDGNPPFKGHGGMSFAMSVAELLRVLEMMKEYENEIEE